MFYIPRWQVMVVALTVVWALMANVPNFFSDQQVAAWPSILPQAKLNLGLDLQGGSYLLLQVETEAVLKERLNDALSEVRVRMRRDQQAVPNARLVGQSIIFATSSDDERALIEKYAARYAPELELLEQSGQLTAQLREAEVKAIADRAVGQSIEIVRRRVDETGTKEPLIQRQGDARILLQLPGITDPQRMKTLLGKTAKMTFHLVEQAIPATQRIRPQPDQLIIDSQELDANGQGVRYVVQRRAMVTGDMLIDAQPSFQDGFRAVSFRFNARGAERFAEVTSTNIGRLFAIVLDNQVISAPRIQSAIIGGSGIITGNFTAEESQNLALLLRAGALPAPLTIIEERSVGPGLGADSIAAGEIAAVVGLLAVVAYTWLIYGRLGWVPAIALTANLVLIMALLTVLQATLTLPGIAGIVLTIGMAVDANVLVFERMREETLRGMNAIPALDMGFNNALSSIIDANVTTLFAGLLLFAVGTGPVKGFAVTLSIGIVTSIFCALMLSRVLLVYWIRWRNIKILPFGQPVTGESA